MIPARWPKRRAVDRPVRVPALLLGRRSVARQEYAGVLARLYDALREVTGSRWIVDSSKAASHGLLLQAVPEVELHVVHLVRDSRAVAHSWQRRKRMPEVHWKEVYMPVFAPRKSSLFWSLENLALRLRRGEIEVKLDAEWRWKMPRSQAVEVTALTWPLLARYGYFGRSGTLLAESPRA